MLCFEWALRGVELGAGEILMTSMDHDGTKKGFALDITAKLAKELPVPVIASGGLASLDDIRVLLDPRARKLAGAIAGRALYDGRLDAAAALKLVRSAEAA